ncbi:MAG: S24/S26 family peptidase [Clostridia bacterium]|nr:S24/S26 family peptidase [Clostridia bacterium]
MNKQIKVDFASLFPLIADAMNQGQCFSFTAFGKSMEPFLRGGVDRVVLGPFRGEPEVGEVYFYRRENGAFVLHRLIRKKGDTLFFCGDNQFRKETGIRREQIIARLEKRIRKEKEMDRATLPFRFIAFFLPVRRTLLWGADLVKRIVKRIGRGIGFSR